MNIEFETILSIKEISQGAFGGYEVETNKQKIKLLMENQQQCCENFNYFWCNDNVNEFIGTNLKNVTLTDKALNTKEIPIASDGAYDCDACFVNLETDKGTLQFVAYNEDNGFYGHDVRIESIQLNYEVCL